MFRPNLPKMALAPLIRRENYNYILKFACIKMTNSQLSLSHGTEFNISE